MSKPSMETTLTLRQALKEEHHQRFLPYLDLSLDEVEQALKYIAAPRTIEKKILVPVEKGSLLTNKVQSFLNNYNVKDVSKIHYNGDLRLNDIVMIECKNYKNVVPTEEVTKFHRDLDMRAVKGGLFVSTSSITSYGNFKMTYYNKNNVDLIPVAYINISAFNNEDEVIQVLSLLIDFILGIINNNHVYIIDKEDIEMVNELAAGLDQLMLVKQELSSSFHLISNTFMNLTSIVSMTHAKFKKVFDIIDRKRTRFIEATTSNVTSGVEDDSLLKEIITHLESIGKAIKKDNKDYTVAQGKIIITQMTRVLKVSLSMIGIPHEHKMNFFYMDNVKISKNEVSINVDRKNINLVKEVLTHYMY
jgi:hypothetical protein